MSASVSEIVAARTGCRYPLADRAMELDQDLWEQLRSDVDALVEALWRRASPTFAQAPPVTRADLIGCVDFHVRDGEARVIEVNAGPPGRLGLTEAIESAYWNVHGVQSPPPNAGGYEDRLVRAVTEGGRYRRIAITVSPLESSAALHPHYAYVAKLFVSRGFEARVVPADELPRADADWRPERLFNLVIVGTWLRNAETFAPLTAALRDDPTRFFPNPSVFGLGNKGLLADLWRDGELRHVLLPTLRLDAVPDAQALFAELGPEVVLKPLDEYGCSGVHIRPDAATVARLIESEAQRMVAQPWFPPDVEPMRGPTGGLEPTGYSLRVGFLDGRSHCVRSYAFSDPLSAGSLAPVVVTPSRTAC